MIKEDILKMRNIQVDRLKKEKPMLLSNILRAMDDYAEQVKSLTIPIVVGQSEQLLAYHEWYLKNRNTVISSDPKTMVEMYVSQ